MVTHLSDRLGRTPGRRPALRRDEACGSTLRAGQGVCTALEDAAELAAALQEQGLCEEALRTYELGRAARLQTMTRVEMVSPGWIRVTMKWEVMHLGCRAGRHRVCRHRRRLSHWLR